MERTCRTAHASEALPARTPPEVAATERLVPLSDLIGEFREHCGGCHMDAADGGYQVSASNFQTTVGCGSGKTSCTIRSTIQDRIKSDDLTRVVDGVPHIWWMPQGLEGQAWSKRAPTDPIVRLEADLEAWWDQGSSADGYTVDLPPADQAYDVPPGMTNIGNCIPGNEFPIGSDPGTQADMDALDERFAAAEAQPPSTDGEFVSGEDQLGLPLSLKDTDLSTLDSAELARHGVIAYAPTYPLWSDGSSKLRYVRVPRGQSIQFDRETQEFTIPPNTRFYKTFLKKVIDRTGQERFRKIETRLIVSRPELPSGESAALFGSYRWNDDETEAILVTDPLRDGTPFKDTLLSYLTNEQKANAIRAANPGVADPFGLDDVRRHYAIPGKQRCIQCHEGSVRGDFVLGFTPLQIWRRPQFTGGVIEPSGADELTQLDRLIGLGVISGLDSAAEIVPLEEIEGDRKPRNVYELEAQGYMFGNCGHCHNPRGYASRSVPELKDVLHFWPNREGGIFQFPLDRMSPRIFRGVEGRPIPYITPSLRDLVPYGFTRAQDLDTLFYTFKISNKEVLDSRVAPPVFIDAPWRSLIYRNTQSPFTYAENFTIFPHMPMNTSGYDCRASRMLGTWMVSIPARRVHPELDEDDLGIHQGASAPFNVFPGDPLVDNEPQPYVEVLPSDQAYDKALTEAEARVAVFQSGERYRTCPDSCYELDVLSQQTDQQGVHCNDVVDFPDLDPALAGTGQQSLSGIPADKTEPFDGVPDHAHWVNTDLTQKQGDYAPRRPDFQSYVLDGHQDALPADPPGAARVQAVNDLVTLLSGARDGASVGPGVRFDATFRQFVSTPFPVDVWVDNPQGQDCDLSHARPASAYSGAARPRWLDVRRPDTNAPVPSDALVFEKLPGGAIYDMICINCHGPNFDSEGRQADTVALLTGGLSRVANFRTGLFGPESAPGANRRSVFVDPAAASSGLGPDDLTARYMSFMALGGTKATIPAPVLQLVSVTNVASQKRPHALINSQSLSANMLAAAQEACRQFVSSSGSPADNVANLDHLDGSLFGFDSKRLPLIQTNGDAELWLRLCTFNNRPPVYAIRVTDNGATYFSSLYDAASYPADLPVGDQRGRVQPGIAWGAAGQEDNLFPWCLVGPIPTQYQGTFAGFPMCPPLRSALEPDGVLQWTGSADAWSQRGAVNAGFAVFAYLDFVSSRRVNPVTGLPVLTLRYNDCHL